MIIHDKNILGVILAGGSSRRMKQTKWKMTLGNKSLLEHSLDRLDSQLTTIAINGSDAELTPYGYPIIEDAAPNQGPLSGLLASLKYAEKHQFEWVVTCPCDAPFFPDNYISKLSEPIAAEQIGAVLQHNKVIHGVFGLWSTQLKVELKTWLANPENRSIKKWVSHLSNRCQVVKLETEAPLAFFNINTPEDYQRAELEYQNNNTVLPKPKPLA